MPRFSIDYSKTIIYKLVHKDDLDDVDIYVGHTTDFTRRKTLHKSNCCNLNSKKYNLKVYRFIRENGGWDEWIMIKMEDYSCKDVHEAKQRERYWLKELKANLNTNEPGRTDKEYREENANKLKEKSKTYYVENTDMIKEKFKKYKEENANKVKEYQKKYREENTDKVKEYQKKYQKQNQEENVERIKQYKKKNYEENAVKIKEKFKEKNKCDICGCEVIRYSLTRHKKSQKCINNNNKSCNIIENGIINQTTAKMYM